MTIIAQTGVKCNWAALASSCNPAKNATDWLNGPLSGVQASDIHETWAKMHLAVHGTSTERALSIISDGCIESHKSLEKSHPAIVAERMQNSTDQLDIRLGLDRYVFLSLGRVHPVSIHPVYFMFKNRLLEKPGVMVSAKEIVHFGALVSPESVNFYKRATGDWKMDSERRNFEAAKQFFSQLFPGADFRSQIFAKFLGKYFPNPNAYWTTFLYPGDKLRDLRVGAEISVNGWEGPQVQVPQRLNLGEEIPSILITTLDPEVDRKITESGFPRDRIFRLKNALPSYQQKYPKLRPFGQINLDQGLYVALALRDLACLSRHNDLGESFPDSMVGFKDFV